MSRDPQAYRDYAALVFDCDGTLVDTMPAHYAAWCRTVEPYGLSFPEDRFYALGGTPGDHIVRMLADEQGVAIADPAQVAHEKELAFAEHLTSVGPVHEVVEIARAYRGLKPMAVATGGFRWLVEKTLANIGIESWFDTLVASDDITHPKPHPETYLEAARRLGYDPVDCCAFEDTDLGLTAAREAGMTAVDIRPMRG